ncbi:MAG: acyltransferase [Nitrospirae bacterium]|nr:acyltransferase [Nitrospirota bacterium]
MKKIPQIEGIDYLRAIMSVFVVTWHMDAGGRSLIFSKDEYMNHLFVFSDFMNFHVLLLAVPTFILISNYIFSLKEHNLEYLKRRLGRLFLLFSFWMIVQRVWVSGSDGIIEMLPDSLSSLMLLIFKGGGIYYFFICLMVTLTGAYYIAKCRTSVVIAGFILSLICLFMTPALAKMLAFYPLCAYWSPSNFIPYPFAAVLLVRLSDQISRLRIKVFIAAVMLALIFSFIEWKIDIGEIFFRGGGYAIPAYARVSMLFSAIALLVIVLNPKITSPKVIKFMSVHSLALYCIHGFFLVYAKDILSIHFNSSMLWRYFFVALIIACSYLISLALRYYIKEEIIR